MVAEDERFTLVLDQPLAHRADLEGRASHVRGDDVSQAELLPEALRADKAADGARLDHPDRARRGLVHRQQPTVGLSHEQLAGEAVLRQLRPQVVEYPWTTGPSRALSAVVDVRSYSPTTGAISCESVRNASGALS